MRIAVGLEYDGASFHGWQTQADGTGVQDALERALSRIADTPLSTVAAGRTDAGVHAAIQVVHFDTDARRADTAWVRGVNALLPSSVAVRWGLGMPADFHARFAATGRHYTYLLLDRPVRPALLAGRVGWYHRPLALDLMRTAADALLGRHDFSAFRAAECQAKSATRMLDRLDIAREDEMIRFDFHADAFLQHMVRNIVGTLLAVGRGEAGTERAREQLESRQRSTGEATAAAHGLYFWNVEYPPQFGLPDDSGMIDFYPLY